MTRPASRSVGLPLMVGLLASMALAAASLGVPIDVRHSAPFGFRLSFDADRGIAVSGALVEPNYPRFDRVDLDLRAYNVDADYDLTVHIRPDAVDAPDVRTLPLPVAGARIRHDKPTFANPFVTLRFPPIADSAGRRYYVWVERGPRNRDDVVALWSVKSYSRVTGRDVLAAFLRPPDEEPRRTATVLFLSALLLVATILFGILMAAVTTRCWVSERLRRAEHAPIRRARGIH